MAKKKRKAPKSSKQATTASTAAAASSTTKPTTASNTKASFWTWDVFVLGALVLFVLMVRVNLLSVPFERDEGGFAYIAYQMIEGKQLYVDLYEIKPPLLYMTYALFITIFGHSVEGIHTGLLLFDVAYIILLFFFARSFFDKTVALVASFAFAILSLSPNLLGFAAHATHFAILPGLGGIMLLMKALEEDNKKLFFWAGLAFGAAFLYKQQVIHFMLFGGVYTIIDFARKKPSNWKNWFISEVILVLGSVLPYALVVLFMIITGRFDDFWFYTFTWPSEFATSSETGASWYIFDLQIKNVMTNQEWLWYLAPAGLVALFVVETKNQWRIFAGLFTLFMSLSVATGFHFYQHYFVVLIPAIALLNGFFVRNVGLLVNKFLKVNWGIVFPLALFALAWSQIIQHDSSYFFAPDSDKILHKAYGTNPFVESPIIGEFIQANSQPTDQLVIACSEPQIGFYAQRQSVTGHAFTYPLVDNGSYMQQLQDEFIEDITTKQPEISVFTFLGTSWLNRDPSGRLFNFMQKMHQENYQLIGVTDCIPMRKTQNGPIFYSMVYKWHQEALPYFNQRMAAVNQGQQNIQNMPIISIWKRRPAAPTQ
jgi:4-amino-4-deoxy-L-arabinose transferase-like glycosyltransferase